MSLWTWTAWNLDAATWGWIGWIVFFVVWETLSAGWGPANMLTDHLRPVFLSAPVVWFVAFGLWLWLGVHLLAPTFEAVILEAVG